jgi:hypothetical protein
MIGEWGPVTSRTVDLNYEQLLMLEGRPGTRVKVIFGGFWLTEEGRLQDVFAHTGAEVALQSPRRAVIEAMGATRIELVEPVARHRLQRLAQRAFDALHGLVRGARALASASAWSPHVPRGTLAALAAVVGVAIPALVMVGIAATSPILSQFI